MLSRSWVTGDAVEVRALQIQVKNVLLLCGPPAAFQISDSTMPTLVGGAKTRYPCLDSFLSGSVKLFSSSNHLFTQKNFRIW